MARRGDHSLEEIKSMILAAAEDLVVEGGLAQLRVRNIAIRIGYTVGSIYMVFDSMNDLILHIKGRTLDALAQQMEVIEAVDPEKHLEELATVYVQFVRQHFNRWSMVYEHRLPGGSVVPAWYQKKIDTIHNKFEKQFAILAPDLNATQRKQIALVFQASIHGLCVLTLANPIADLNGNDLEESIKTLTRHLIYDGWAGSVNAMTSPNQVIGVDNWRPKTLKAAT